MELTVKVRILVTLKEEVTDTHGLGILNQITLAGHSEVTKVRYGRLFDLVLDEDDRRIAYMRVREMCEALLTNNLIEDYEITVDR
jgi:phosphoribosylformylglycinamidine synthase PurS subunit